MILARELIDRFRHDGFVVVPDVFSSAELDDFGPAVDAAVADDMSADSRTLAEKSRYEQSFQQCLYLWTRYEGVRPLTCHPRLAHAAAQLLGADAVRVWHDQALYKEAGGRATDPHQDQPYWPIAEPETVTAWIPLDGSTRAAGAMSYYPGSHLVGLHRFVNIFGHDDPPDIALEPALDGVTPVAVEVPRGSVAFHHGLTAHFAEPNRTDRTRRVHTVIYLADGCHRSTDSRHLSVDFDSIEPGGPIDGSLTPILWPRADGDLPAPPAAVGARRR